jgi:hypothetical protein
MSDKFFSENFADLERFAPDWVIGDIVERQRKRADSELATVRQFFEDLFPEIDRIITYLNTVPMDAMGGEDKNLYWLVVTWNEMSHPIDLKWEETDETWSFPFDRIQLWERAPTD